MSSLFTEIGRNLRRSAPLLLVFSAVMVLFSRVFDGTSSAFGGSLAAVMILSYAIFRAALFDGPLFRKPRGNRIDVPPEALGRFLLLSFVFVVLVAGPSLYLAVGAAGMGSEFNRTFLLVFLMISAPLAWLLLAFFGTMFPAAAAGARISPLIALRAARGTWWRVALQLALLPGLFLVLFILLAGPALEWLDRAERWNPVSVALETFLTALLLVPQVLAVVILTRAYRRGWPRISQPKAAETGTERD